MRELSQALKAGTRNSPLALIQSQGALDRLAGLFPGVDWTLLEFSSPGDRDRKTDLRESPEDFFSRDLDEALIRGELDCAVHSAKDLVYPLREELDWFWLPWREDPADVLICRPGERPEELSAGSVIGVSSERREAFCRRAFPDWKRAPIRGNIGDRLAQLDRGDFDMILMAAAALNRLGLEERITRRLSLEELPVPEGQGFLALTFRRGDERMMRIRSFFTTPALFVGAGPGSASLCTLKGAQALESCDICLHDSLIDWALLERVKGEAVHTGKRSGRHSLPQQEISRLISLYVRQGKRVVRLKGGDPGIFGRLAEEAAELEAFGLPYEVVPGISSLNAASAATGMLLTRRGVSRGFSVISSRLSGGALGETGKEIRSRLPVVFFMSLRSAEEVLASLIREGRSADEPAAVVYDAGSPTQEVLRGTLATLGGLIRSGRREGPGLIIAGEVAAGEFRNRSGALEGRRVLLTCSGALMDRAADLVFRWGGVPLEKPLIRLERVRGEWDPRGFDWIVLTSPSAVGFFMEALRERREDLRRLPRIMVCGAPSAEALEAHGLRADVVAEPPFGAEALAAAMQGRIRPGEGVLRLRSDRAGRRVDEALRALGARVEDHILYRNRDCARGELPPCEAVFFASRSAVEAFLRQWGPAALEGRTLLALGNPTAEALREKGFSGALLPPEASLPRAVEALALHFINTRLEDLL